jgi:anti-sigma factor RsiW
MSELPVTEGDLQAHVDGRLPQGRGAEVDAWLAARPEEAARLAAYRKHAAELRALYAPVLDEPMPDALAHAARPRRSWWRQAAAAVALLALGGAIGWQMHVSYGTRAPAPEAVPRIVRNAVVAHATYSPEVRHPVEVGADQEQHLVAWLSKRLGAKVRAPNLESVGYSLVGGRLLPGEAGPAGTPTPTAQFMYQCKQGTRVTLYVRAEGKDHKETAFRYATEGKVRVFYWIDRSFGYALSSADIDKQRLLEVANATYAQLNP